MKVIELLNKIANGEEVPKKIKWGCHIYTWLAVEYKALDELGEPLFSEQAGYTKYSLNDEIEIIEEDKKIEKLNYNNNDEFDIEGFIFDFEQKMQIVDKINEIIEVLNEQR